MTDLNFCADCEEEPASPKNYTMHDGDEPWCRSSLSPRKCSHYLCEACYQKAANAEPDMDRILADYYGASTPQTEGERYEIAAREKRGMR
jgi:hypothetical protein